MPLYFGLINRMRKYLTLLCAQAQLVLVKYILAEEKRRAIAAYRNLPDKEPKFLCTFCSKRYNI